MPKQGLPANTQIQNQASIVFDANPAIAAHTWLNTLDNTPPTSSVQGLPSAESPAGFTVSWSGTDVGSGIGTYNIYVSINGGPFAAWQQNTTATSVTYTGTVGQTYGFLASLLTLSGTSSPRSRLPKARRRSLPHFDHHGEQRDHNLWFHASGGDAHLQWLYEWGYIRQPDAAASLLDPRDYRLGLRRPPGDRDRRPHRRRHHHRQAHLRRLRREDALRRARTPTFARGQWTPNTRSATCRAP